MTDFSPFYGATAGFSSGLFKQSQCSCFLSFLNQFYLVCTIFHLHNRLAFDSLDSSGSILLMHVFQMDLLDRDAVYIVFIYPYVPGGTMLLKIKL